MFEDLYRHSGNHSVTWEEPFSLRECPSAVSRRHWVVQATGGPRTNPDGIEDTNLGVLYDCLACLGRKHKHHPDHTRDGEPPQVCRHYNEEFGDWTCEACLRRRLIIDTKHTLIQGCRYEDGGVEIARWTKKQLGLQAVAGPVRDLATPAAGIADGDPITDDLTLDEDVGDEGIGAVSAPNAGSRDSIVTKEERSEGTPSNFDRTFNGFS